MNPRPLAILALTACNTLDPVPVSDLPPRPGPSAFGDECVGVSTRTTPDGAPLDAMWTATSSGFPTTTTYDLGPASALTSALFPDGMTVTIGWEEPTDLRRFEVDAELSSAPTDSGACATPELRAVVPFQVVGSFGQAEGELRVSIRGEESWLWGGADLPLTVSVTEPVAARLTELLDRPVTADEVDQVTAWIEEGAVETFPYALSASEDTLAAEIRTGTATAR